MSKAPYPLDPLTPDEIKLTATLVKKEFPNERLYFKVITLQEPRKNEMVAFLEAEANGETKINPPRMSWARYYISNQKPYHEALVNLTEQIIDREDTLPAHFHSRLDEEAIFESMEYCLADPAIKIEIARQKLPEDVECVCEPWIYGTDDEATDEALLYCFFYVQTSKHPENNIYAHPLDFGCKFNLRTKEVYDVERLPTFEDPEIAVDENKGWLRTKTEEYAPELIEVPLRKDLKPINITQPEGPSFTIKDRIIEWQKWRFHLGWNYREGPILQNVTYEGRPTFYRLSLSEMTVPYADPRLPYHRKQAFDLGDNGAGACANSLELGCDCLGHIAYFDGYINNQAGDVIELKNVVCIHEQDNGIGWKHKNYRNGKASVVRNRELIVQTIITVANYEYIFAWILGQSADIQFEVRATGIMSTCAMDPKIKSTSYGIAVQPGTFATSHQHIFNVRIDPSIDGYEGAKVAYEDTIPIDPHSKTNKWGVGFETISTKIDKPGFLDADVSKNRILKLYHPSKTNAITGLPVSYKLIPLPSQMILAHEMSYNQKRAEFADHALWISKYEDDQLYSGSEHTNQSKGGHGIKAWTETSQNLGDDAVVWHTFTLTHIPRPEDWPLLSVVTKRFTLEPCGFFNRNPAIDVPPTNISKSRSVLYQNGVKTNGDSCH